MWSRCYGHAHPTPLLPVVHIWDVRDGTIARFQQFIDTVKFAEVVPVPAAV